VLLIVLQFVICELHAVFTESINQPRGHEINPVHTQAIYRDTLIFHDISLIVNASMIMGFAMIAYLYVQRVSLSGPEILPAQFRIRMRRCPQLTIHHNIDAGPLCLTGLAAEIQTQIDAVKPADL
jgi:hypothetical protein